MKKILVLSYHYPPLNVIASRRAEAYAKYFHLYNWYPTVVTHDWVPVNEIGTSAWLWHRRGTVVKKEQETNATVYRLPRIRSGRQQMIDLLLKLPGIKTFVRTVMVAAGFPQPELYYSYQAYKKFLWQHLQQAQYDCVLAIYSPDYHIKLAYEIYKRFGIDFVADYRDLWDNRLAEPQKVFSIKDRFLHKFAIRTHTRWLSKALFYTIVSAPWLNIMQQLTGNPTGYVLTNGFESDSFSANSTPVSTEFFFITYTGRVYPQNDFSCFYKGLQFFLQKLGNEEQGRIKVRFYSWAHLDLSEQKRMIPEKNLEIHPWVEKNTVITVLKESAILFLPGFANQPGTYPGKVFEYLGTGRNILVTPSDNNVLAALIAETHAGICTSDAEEVAGFLAGKFEEWKKTGQPSYGGQPGYINKYARENRVGEMASIIIDIILSDKRKEKNESPSHYKLVSE
jgi:glycosyltransferase involved in cell wall biosynthesis